MRFASDWGYGGVVMANLFAYRATQPAELKTAMKPVGPRNNRWLRDLSAEADLVIAAWGNDGVFLNRANAVRKMIRDLHCLKINGSGEPAHPLYIPAAQKPLCY